MRLKQPQFNALLPWQQIIIIVIVIVNVNVIVIGIVIVSPQGLHAL